VWVAKLEWFFATLRDQWFIFDRASAAVLTFIVIAAAITNPWFSFSRNLAVSALILFAVFILLPYVVFGSAYADMRLTPYMFAIALIGIRVRPTTPYWVKALTAALALCFFGARMTETTMSFAQADARYTSALGALDHVPVGARLVSFVGRPCRTQWGTNKMEHLPALAIVRRHAFSNDQWEMAGAQLMASVYPEGSRIVRHFGRDPSQMVTEPTCKSQIWHTLNWSLANLPRDKFDYVWIIDPPPYDAQLLHGMTKIWAGGSNALYRIGDRGAAGTQP